MESKSFFFGLSLAAPWPEFFPLSARLIEEQNRHITLAFLGKYLFQDLLPLLDEIPPPSFKMAPLLLFDRLLFLPEKHPHLIAYHFLPLRGKDLISPYQKELSSCLIGRGFQLEEREFFPHVTIGRDLSSIKDWEEHFVPFPFYIDGFHLYESLGFSEYRSHFTLSFLPPFKEIEHVADLAFQIVGRDLSELSDHAQVALCFIFPELFPFFKCEESKRSLEDVIIALNKVVTRADQEIGSPLKAVSFHGEVMKNEEGLLTWEMIIDV
ncbi:MAG: hypothetical protein HYZ47_04680 [Simkania negevensis]|nr:hypothetical protein [Simkania negevensis]